MEEWKKKWDAFPRKYKTLVVFGIIVAGLMLFGQ